MKQGLLQKLLSSPALYMASQTLSGAKRARSFCVDNFVPKRPGLRVLDLGCGTGYVSAYFRDADYWGFDISEPYIAYAKNKYGQYGQFFCQDLNTDVLDSFGKFDLVIMNGLLHHLNDDEVIDFMTIAKTALLPTGKVLTLDGCYEPYQSRLAKKLLNSDRGKYVRFEDEYCRIVRKVFAQVKSQLFRDLLYLPYTIIIIECSN